MCLLSLFAENAGCIPPLVGLRVAVVVSSLLFSSLLFSSLFFSSFFFSSFSSLLFYLLLSSPLFTSLSFLSLRPLLYFFSLSFLLQWSCSPLSHRNTTQTITAEKTTSTKPGTSSSTSLLAALNTGGWSGSSGSSVLAPSSRVFQASLFLFKREVLLGFFPTVKAAGGARDKAFIRAVGPEACREKDLNFDVESYAALSMEAFAAFDPQLRETLFGTPWSGPKVC
jgi:hypothetical protein